MLIVKAHRIIRERPTYDLFTNNCQNFAKFLIETICGVVASQESIQDVLRRLDDEEMKRHWPKIPGAYPESSMGDTFISAFSQSFYTVEEDSYFSAYGESQSEDGEESIDIDINILRFFD